MSDARDLIGLLRSLEPDLGAEPYAFVELVRGTDDRLAASAFALVREQEGAGAIVTLAQARALDRTPWFVAARLTLRVTSDLEAVGLTAAVATRLAEEGIACNVVAGLRHDHLFVPWDARRRALAALLRLAAEAGDPPD